MNKNSQIKILIKSLKEGLFNECLTYVQSINLNDVFEYHLQEDFDNGVYNKLSNEEIESIISHIEDSIEIQIKLVNI